MWFTRISIQNPVFATMMMLALMVLGLFAYQRMPLEQFPDVSFPVVVVQTTYPGASPESVESDITRPIEEAVNSVNGIDTLTSRSYEGVSVVIIQFQLTVDPGLAAQDVREKVAAVRSTFRKEIDEPRVSRYDPADSPIISYAVSADNMSLRDLTTYTDQVITKRLENVRGVGSVNIIGGIKREIQIHLKPEQMEALSVSVDQVLNAIRNENQELPAGSIRSLDNEKVVQIEGRIKSPADFNRIIVARRGSVTGSGTALQPVTLDQVATVVDGQEERENLALIDGRPTLSLDVLKAQGENTVNVVDGLSQALAALKPALPQGVAITTVRDSSISIRAGVNGVKESILEGALLTILIVFLFLNSWRSTVITGLTLPIALIGTFLFMNIFGFTINSLTLMALSLCVGLLIDDAIVVRENIVRHAGMRINGRFKGHHQAALDGTQEIGLAVLATTFSIVAVFLPVGFMGGIIGRFFHQFGITVVAAVLISMFVSFTLDPMLSSIWPDPDAQRHGHQPRNWLGRFLGLFDRQVQKLSRWYQDILGWSLKHRGKTLLFALATFIASLMLAPLVGSEFIPQGDYSETSVSFNTPVGSSLELTEAKARQVNAALHEFPEVLYTYTTINTGQVAGKNYATVYVRLKDRKDRKRSQAELTQPIRQRLGQIAGITLTQVTPPSSGGPPGKVLQVSLQGTNLKELERLSLAAQEKLRRIPGLTDLDSSLKEPKPTIAVQINRDLASDLGIGVSQIGSALRPLLAGEDVSTWRAPDDENYSVVVRLDPEDRNRLDDLNRLMLASTQVNADGSPKMVPLRQVATITPSTGANQINRSDLAREVSLDANVFGRSAGEVSADMEKALKTLDYPPGYRYKLGGSSKNQKESAGYALSALFLAVIFIYMILASQFHSFLQPIAIMTSLPLTLIGVLLAMLLFGSTINLYTMIGFIMLMGLVTKNAILLIDFANQARAGNHDGEHGEPLERAEALLAAARVRLRPILMTTLAMIFGMLPLALSLSEGSEQRAPLGQAIIGGVITSSLLTLVVVPVMYTYLDDLTIWLKARWHKNKSHNPSQEMSDPV